MNFCMHKVTPLFNRHIPKNCHFLLCSTFKDILRDNYHPRVSVFFNVFEMNLFRMVTYASSNVQK